MTDYRIKPKEKVVVLTGAGISAESGIKTFRDENGLWRNWKIEEVASYDAFTQNPSLVWEFYRMRYLQLSEVSPNPAHHALAEFEDKLAGRYTLITQNVDGLHLEAGSRHVLEMHGSLRRTFCDNCGKKYATNEINVHEEVPECKICGGNLRPDIVWFGEIPYSLDKIEAAMQGCDLFLVIGTSGVVYPAAGLLSIARSNNSYCIGVNLDAPSNLGLLNEFHQGKAGEILPKLLNELTGEF